MRDLAALLGLATATVGWRLGARAGRWPAFFAGLLLTFDPLLLAGRFSGMELPLFGLLTLLIVESMLDGRTRATGWLAGLALLTRPEGMLLAGVAFVRAARRKERLTALLLPILACAVPFAAYNLWVAGHPWPNTWGNKFSADFDLGGAGLALAALVGDTGWGWAAPLLLAVGSIALAGAERALPRLLLIVSGMLLLGILLTRELPLGFDPPRLPFYWQRYALVAWPPLLLVMGAGLASLVRTAWAGTYCRPFAAIALVGPLILVGALAQRLPAHAAAVAGRFAAECAQVEAQNVAAGMWIDSHLPPDALVATHDAGAVRYFGRRAVLDIWFNNDAASSALHAESERRRGTPEQDRADKAFKSYLHARKPDALAVFPALWASGHSPEFQELMRSLPPEEAQKLTLKASDYAGFFGLTRRAAEFRVDEPATVDGPPHRVFAVYVRP
jgi:hypothetical protein